MAARGSLIIGLDERLADLEALYQDLHEHPELSFQEQRTAALMAERLAAAGFEVTSGVGETGVVGVLRNGDGPGVLLRADMDALPVTEEVDVPFASKVRATYNGQEVGVMHACGHDIHMSTFIGTARALGKMKDKWHGTIIFIGQPAEETVGGARALLKDGLYTRWPKPNYVLGLHDDAEIATGQIGVTEGYCYANVDSVDVTVKGMGGHGAYPHKTKDPVVLSAEIINGWQTIASRETNPHDDVVVTVGSIHGGTKHNIISDEVKMQLTVRTYKKEVRDAVLALRRAAAVAEVAGERRVAARPQLAAEDVLLAHRASFSMILFSREASAAITSKRCGRFSMPAAERHRRSPILSYNTFMVRPHEFRSRLQHLDCVASTS